MRGGVGNECVSEVCKFLSTHGSLANCPAEDREQSCGSEVSAKAIDSLFTCTHDPLAIFADSDTLASLFEFEILEELNAIRKFGVVFQAAFPLSCQPFWERASSG